MILCSNLSDTLEGTVKLYIATANELCIRARVYSRHSPRLSRINKVRGEAAARLVVGSPVFVKNLGQGYR